MNGSYFYTNRMSVGYNGRPLIREIEMRVGRGEILTLIGPNGGGKSTILKSITRQLSLIGGTVCLDNRDLQTFTGKELAQKLAVMLTERVRTELMTCEDVVSTGRYPYTGRLGILSEEDHKKVDEAMALVHALELRRRDFHSISDGQRQRILLARAICQEPEMIVLDEPTSFLDIRHKLELLSILKKLVKERGVSVVMSLHELDLAQKISDFVICVKGDTIDKAGTPEEVFISPYITELYGITAGSYDELFGSIEMEAEKGEPEVFIIGGNGSGIRHYRRLQRKGIPFAAGVLHKNDMDYEVAKTLAVQVVAEEPFEPVSEAHYREALEIMKQCKTVICSVRTFGAMNAFNKKLAQEAKRIGKSDTVY